MSGRDSQNSDLKGCKPDTVLPEVPVKVCFLLTIVIW